MRNVTPPELRPKKPAFATLVLVYPERADWARYAKGVGPLTTSLMIWGGGDKDESDPTACANFFPPENRRAEFKDRIFPDTYHGYGFNLPKWVTVFGASTKKTSSYNPQANEETFAGTVAWFNARLR